MKRLKNLLEKVSSFFVVIAKNKSNYLKGITITLRLLKNPFTFLFKYYII